MENKAIKYLTSICFAILALYNAYWLIEAIEITGVISVVGCILVVISILTSTNILTTIGLFLIATVELINFFKGIGLFVDLKFFYTLIVIWGVDAIVYLCLLVISIRKNFAKTVGIIATFFSMFRLVFGIIRLGFNFNIIFYGLLLAACSICLWLNYVGVTNVAKTSRSNESINVANNFSDDNIEKIVRLKNLLDAGMITQEEFDEKKKKLLNL